MCVLHGLWHVQAWMPEYHRLSEGSSEKAVFGLLIFAGNVSMMSVSCTIFSRTVHDARIFDAFGGFAECRRAWRRYDYHRDHALACSASGMGDDVFLYFALSASWLFRRDFFCD